MRIFIDREKELEYLRNYVLKFPLPLEDMPRSRQILMLIGPKGVGKSTVLRELVRQGLDDTVFVYIELRGPYESQPDLLIDIIKQLFEALDKQKPRWLEAIARVLKALGVKIVGRDVIEMLTYPDTVEVLSRSRPTLLLKVLEEELCRLCERDNVRLVTIYDEFQNFLKTISSSIDRYEPLLDTFITYLSKTQEWGFRESKGYPIRILAASDYLTYSLLGKHIGTYVTVLSINELESEYAKKMLTMLLQSYGVSYDEPFVDYAIRLLGGNPSLILRFVDKLRELGEKYLVPEVVNEVVDKLVTEELLKLQRLGSAEKIILEELYNLTRREGTSAIDIDELWRRVRGYTVFSEDGYRLFREKIGSLLEENILQLVESNKVAFQNRLIMYAAGRL